MLLGGRVVDPRPVSAAAAPPAPSGAAASSSSAPVPSKPPPRFDASTLASVPSFKRPRSRQMSQVSSRSSHGSVDDRTHGVLASMAEEQWALPTLAKPRARANSTDSLWTVFDIAAPPNSDEIAFSASCYLHDRLVMGEQHLSKLRDKGKQLPPLFHGEVRGEVAGEVPSEDDVYEYLMPLHAKADFSVECYVVALLYIERYFIKVGTPPLTSNWQRLIFTALILAAKVWDDVGSSNGDFANVGGFSNKDVNQMEADFLIRVGWDIKIQASLFASTLFELKAMCESSAENERVPRKPRGLLDAQRAEVRQRDEERESRQASPSFIRRRRLSATTMDISAHIDDATSNRIRHL